MGSILKKVSHNTVSLILALTLAVIFYVLPLNGEMCSTMISAVDGETLSALQKRAFSSFRSTCRKETRVRSDWQLVFIGAAWTGRNLYDLWTNTTWDSGSEDGGNYRNETLFNAWNNGQLNIYQVKLSLNEYAVVFDGVDSDILSWFAKERLVSSPWSDLTTTATTSYFAISGSLEHSSRRFLISKSQDGCDEGLGWLVVEDLRGNCVWDQPEGNYPLILYSTSKAVNFKGAFNDETLGMADYLTIFIKTE